MFHINLPEFEKIIDKAIASLPKQFVSHLDNIAFLVDQEPSAQQRQALQLRGDQTLFGLYEGVPLPGRQGYTKLLPDKITLFQKPLEYASSSMAELRTNISRTVWHEVAHYYGLDHSRIYELEAKERRGNGATK